MPESPKSISRTHKGQAFHKLLTETLRGKGAKPLSKVEEFIETNKENKSFLGELSCNGFSALNDIIHLGKEHKYPQIPEVFDLIAKHLSKEQKKSLAENITNDGFSLLNHAADSGNDEIFRTTFKFIKETIGKKEAFKLLAHPNKQGFTALHTANNSMHYPTIKTVIGTIKDLYRDKESRDFETLQTIFETLTSTGYKATDIHPATKRTYPRVHPPMEQLLTKTQKFYEDEKTKHQAPEIKITARRQRTRRPPTPQSPQSFTEALKNIAQDLQTHPAP